MQGITLSRVLAADTAGHQMQKAYEMANYTLAGATPLAVLSSKDGFLQRVADLGFAFALPVHMHVGLNACVSDYLPSSVRAPVRAGLLGVSAITFIGLIKLNLAGAGVTQTVKGLWHKPDRK